MEYVQQNMMTMRITIIIAILVLLLSAPLAAKSSNKPFAAWPLPDGEFAYLTPNDETKIRVIDGRGKWQGSYIKETGKGGILMPWDMVGSPDGYLFVLDRMKAKINVYDYNFKFQYSFGEKGTGYGQLKSPRALAIDARGYIYVANNGNNRIEKFNIKGDHKGYLEPLSGEGVGTEFKYITAMVVSPGGELYVAVDSEDPSVLRNIYTYNTNGDLTGTIKIMKWGGSGKFVDLALNEDNTLLIVDTPSTSGGFAGAVWRVDSDGVLLGKYEPYDSDFDRYYSPVEVILYDGMMYIFCAENKCLVYDASGGYIRSFGL